MCDTVCPYKDKCISHPNQCGTCSRNTGKRDYYKPRRRDWYYPYYPHWQYLPQWTTYRITCDGNNNTPQDTHTNWDTNTTTWNTTWT